MKAVWKQRSRHTEYELVRLVRGECVLATLYLGHGGYRVTIHDDDTSVNVGERTDDFGLEEAQRKAVEIVQRYIKETLSYYRGVLASLVGVKTLPPRYPEDEPDVPETDA